MHVRKLLTSARSGGRSLRRRPTAGNLASLNKVHTELDPIADLVSIDGATVLAKLYRVVANERNKIKLLEAVILNTASATNRSGMLKTAGHIVAFIPSLERLAIVIAVATTGPGHDLINVSLKLGITPGEIGNVRNTKPLCAHVNV